MNLSIELRYLVAFVVFSFGIARLVWPPGHRYLGLLGGLLALVGATWLGATLVDLGGLFALVQQPPPQVGWAWLQKLIDSFWAVLIYWLNQTQPTLPALFTNLALIVLLLGAYAALKSLLVSLTWALYSAWQLVDRITRKVSEFLAQKAPSLKPWVSGVLVFFSFILALVPYTARLVQPALRVWDSFAPNPQQSPELPGYMLFLKRTVRNSLLFLGLPLAILPYAVKLHPILPAFFALLFWVGLWVLLLEIFQWLYSASYGPAASEQEAETEASLLSRSLEALYRAYLQLHNDPEVGNKALLFFGHRGAPCPASSSPAAVPANVQPTATLAANLRQRLGNYLPPTLLDTLADSATRYESGHDLLFTETLCCYHFLLLTELIQHHHNQSEAVLLLCPQAAVAQVEAALEQQVRLHQLPLTQRWAVLGRDTLGPDAQVNVLISPDTVLETHLFQHLSNLTSILERLRLFICLDIQDLRLSSLRLTLGRLWLLRSRDSLRVVAQAQPYQAMEQQVRYLSEFMPDLVQCRLNPQLLAQRYLLVWDEHTTRQNALAQHYFPGYSDALELSPLLLLEPWLHQFNVIHLDPIGRHNEDELEHLRKDLLAQHQYDHLLPYCRQHEAVGHLYAAQSRLVYQIADASNLALALDHNTNFSGAPASLLNVVCGNYLLRDYYRACLYGVGNPQDLSLLLRPLAVRPQGTLTELARALGSALQGEAGSGGLDRHAIVTQFLNLVPATLLAHFGIRADWVNLQQLFTLTQSNPPPLGIRLGDDQQPYYSISPRNYTTQPRYYRVCNEAGDEIAQWPAEEHGLVYAMGQLVLVGGKFHRVLQVGGGRVRVQHQESESRDLRRRSVFDRRYTLEPGPQYEDGQPFQRVMPGRLHLKIVHLHRGFIGESLGYWELNEDMQPLRERLPDYIPLNPVLRRVHKLQNVAYLRIEQTDLVGEADLAVVAFTLCAVFQDCLTSLFPPQSAKLAVVSPQSTRLDPDNQDEITRFYHQLYPAWAPPATAESAEAVPDTDCLEFYLFEDADHDLGVARVLCDGQGAQILLGIAGDYLHWAATQQPEQLYHAYGNPASWPACLDYAGALALVNKLRQAGNRLVVAPLDQGGWGAA